MTYVAVDKRGEENVFSLNPIRRYGNVWGYSDKQINDVCAQIVPLPKGSIKHLIGRELKWQDEPVKL